MVRQFASPKQATDTLTSMGFHADEAQLHVKPGSSASTAGQSKGSAAGVQPPNPTLEATVPP